MKLQSFYLPIAIFICVCITFVSVTYAYSASVDLEMFGGTNCRLWVTDQTGKRLAGDGPGDYHDCSADPDGTSYDMGPFDDVTFWLNAKVQGSFRKTKDRGPFYGNTCYRIHGDAVNWWFDSWNCTH